LAAGLLSPAAADTRPGAVKNGSSTCDDAQRLEAVRRVFFPTAGRTLGGHQMSVRTQAKDPSHRDYRENVRFTRGRVVLATGVRTARPRGSTSQRAVAERKIVNRANVA
jgi:hypothetical protein